MSKSSFASEGNVNSVSKKRVYYEGTDTIYEGMVLCYNQDTTTDMNGTTIAEGSQCSGKYTRTEKPATANMKFIAGVVAGVSKVGQSGPKYIDVYECNGAIVPMRGTESFTIGDRVYTVPADYEVTNVPLAGSVLIGYAMETIDRSSTEGLVLVRTVVPEAGASYQAGAGATYASSLIWKDVDLDRLRNDPSYGFMYEDHFLGQIDITTGDGWTVTAVNSGGITRSATEAGGVMVFDSAGNNAADDGVNVQLTNCMFQPAAGRSVYFEARVKMNDATDQYFLGLAGVDTTLIASGVVDDVVDKCGFFHHAASTDNKISTISSRTSSEEIDADVATNTDATYMTVGFVISGLTSVTFYVNGVAVGTVVDTNDIPNAVMCLSSVAQIEGTGADAEMSVDWVRIAQVGLA